MLSSRFLCAVALVAVTMCSEAAAQTTAKVTLDDARVMAVASKSNPGFIQYIFRPRWANANPARVKVEYRFEFRDSSNAILFEDKETLSIDAFTSDAKTYRVVSVFGNPSDRFEAKSLSMIHVFYRAAGDQQEKQYRNVPIVRTSE